MKFDDSSILPLLDQSRGSLSMDTAFHDADGRLGFTMAGQDRPTHMASCSRGKSYAPLPCYDMLGSLAIAGEVPNRHTRIFSSPIPEAFGI